MSVAGKSLKNILVYSVAPWIPSGYGTQCAFLARSLRDLGYNVMIAAYRGLSGASVGWEGIQVQPWTAHSRFSSEMLPYYYALHEADLCITLTDLFIFGELKVALAAEASRQDGMRFAHWMPIDATPLGWPDYNILKATQGIPLAMSRFGETQLRIAGFKPVYLPHAIDTDLFRPLAPEVISGVRERLGIPQNAFVIGIDATNEDVADRKGWSEQLHAFRQFRARHLSLGSPPVLLWMHTLKNRHPVGLDLETMVDRLCLSGSVRFSDEELLKTGSITAQMMALMTGSWDLYTGCAKAEGFGLPIAQAQACGIPAVVTGASAMPEVAAPGWHVSSQPHWSPLHGSDWACPGIGAIDAAYESAWQLWALDSPATEPGEAEPTQWLARKRRAREHALQYGLKTVTEQHLVPAMEECARRIDQSRQVPEPEGEL